MEIVNCWIPSECLGMLHANQNKFLLDQERYSTDVDIDLTHNKNNQSEYGGRAIEEPLTRHMQDGITDYRNYAYDSNAPLNTILVEVQYNVQQDDLLNCLNIPATLDAVFI